MDKELISEYNKDIKVIKDEMVLLNELLQNMNQSLKTNDLDKIEEHLEIVDDNIIYGNDNMKECQKQKTNYRLIIGGVISAVISAVTIVVIILL